MAEGIQDTEATQSASAPGSPAVDDPKHPEFRSRANLKPAQLVANYPVLYRKDQGVWLIGARSMKGPYTVAKVNGDGTYDLNNESGTPFKYKVKEKDLKPV